MSKLQTRIARLEAEATPADTDVVAILAQGRARCHAGLAREGLPTKAELLERAASGSPGRRGLARARIRAGLYQQEGS